MPSDFSDPNAPPREYESDLVHLSVRNPLTGMHGCWATDTADLRTACGVKWKRRPQRTLVLALVTCPGCSAS